jgi:hypothetical protein
LIAEVLNGDELTIGVTGDREAVAVQIHLATDCMDAFSFLCTGNNIRGVIGLATGLITLERRGRWDIFQSLFNDGGHGGSHRAMAVNHGVPAEARVPFRMRRGCGGHGVQGRARELSARRDDNRERKRWAIRNAVHDRNTAEAHGVFRVIHRGFVKIERVGHSGKSLKAGSDSIMPQALFSFQFFLGYIKKESFPWLRDSFNMTYSLS